MIMKNKLLYVYFFEEFAGVLQQDQLGTLSFQYDQEYLNQKDAKPISIALPLREAGFVGRAVEAFFAGFLPEDIVREQLAKIFGISADNDFSLLEHIGGECAGAVSLYHDNKQKHTREIYERKTINLEQLEDTFTKMSTRPLLSRQGKHRLSLAGAQNKLAVCVKFTKNAEVQEIYLPGSDELSTHIIKPRIADFPDTAHNEFFCVRLASEVGIPTNVANLHFAGEIPYLILERYDRYKQGRHFKRLHQEDFCQALSLSPKLKYQSEGGPGLARCFALVSEYSSIPALDKLTLLRAVIFNFLIGNNDAHAKNFSFLYSEKSMRIRLSPLYDLLSTAVYTTLDQKLAMKIGKKNNYRRIRPHDWESFADDVNISTRLVREEFKSMSHRVLESAHTLQSTLYKSFPSLVYEKIIKVIEHRKTYGPV